MADQLVIPPPTPKLSDYPVAWTICGEVIAVALLVFMAARFDPTGGVLTISLLVVLAFISAAVFSLFFTIPTDEATAAILGGLVAGFGAVVAHWLGRTKEGPK
jgi:peptidoglycan/LPS O-acetylase OafA/YrhL